MEATDVERVLFALVADRAIDPMSKLATAEWATYDVAVPGLRNPRSTNPMNMTSTLPVRSVHPLRLALVSAPSDAVHAEHQPATTLRVYALG